MNKENKKTIFSNNVKEFINVCPYCMNDYSGSESGRACCGEVHSEMAMVTNDGECYLMSEVKVLTRTPAMYAIDRIVDIFGASDASKWLNSLEIHKCSGCGKDTIWPMCQECEEKNER